MNGLFVFLHDAYQYDSMLLCLWLRCSRVFWAAFNNAIEFFSVNAILLKQALFRTRRDEYDG